MDSIQFKEANLNLLPPDGMSEKECKDLWVWSDGRMCISKWKLSWRDRIHCLFHGFIWLWVLSGKTQPPVIISAEKTVFVDARKERKNNDQKR